MTKRALLIVAGRRAPCKSSRLNEIQDVPKNDEPSVQAAVVLLASY